MLFNSGAFVLFFCVAVAVHFLLPARARPAWLLIASYYFYMAWNPVYVVLLMTSTGVDYVAGRALARVESRPARRALLASSIGVNLGLLFVFKYYDFAADTLLKVAAALGFEITVPELDLLLPLGISFYTFQTMSYTIDVYRRKLEPESNLVLFALYVSFFPQLVAGPIERATRLLPELRREHRFDPQRIADGLLVMIWGFVLKMGIADRLAPSVEEVFGNVQAYAGVPLLGASYAFTIQIYCDFAGYSLIAIGAGRVLGVKLMANFRDP